MWSVEGVSPGERRREAGRESDLLVPMAQVNPHDGFESLNTQENKRGKKETEIETTELGDLLIELWSDSSSNSSRVRSQSPLKIIRPRLSAALPARTTQEKPPTAPAAGCSPHALLCSSSVCNAP